MNNVNVNSSNSQLFRGHIVDVVAGRIFKGQIEVRDGLIFSIEECEVTESTFFLPGFVDAHVHVESSMLVPSEFAKLAVIHGTLATVSDPHEIGNVLGVEGVHFMLEDAARVPFRFCFGAPSCVPATNFETAGARIDVAAVERLLALPQIRYLSEMMNFPGVLHEDPEVMGKIAAAKKRGKVVDGHAPGLRGELAARYISAGISTDHECVSREEAEEKIELGMKILIREASAAKNFNALIDLLAVYPEQIMFCSDDKHPNDLVRGHINELVKRAIKAGHEPMNVLRAAILNPVRHYGINLGLLQKGDAADFIEVESLDQLTVLNAWIEGVKVAERGRSLIRVTPARTINNFSAEPIDASALKVRVKPGRLRVIEACNDQLVTKELFVDARVREGYVESDPEQDVLKLVVMSRYPSAEGKKLGQPAVAFVRNFGFKEGAIATSVAHDCHNIIAVGCSDEEIVEAINLLISVRGACVVVGPEGSSVLPLPVAGLMSNQDGRLIGAAYDKLESQARTLGSSLTSPFMTLSFLALLVIPKLKLSDQGLFDGEKFEFVPLFE